MVYEYSGPVKVFDKIVSQKWSGQTTADSEKKARSNLAYQYKKSHNFVARSKVILPGKLTEVG